VNVRAINRAERPIRAKFGSCRRDMLKLRCTHVIFPIALFQCFSCWGLSPEAAWRRSHHASRVSANADPWQKSISANGFLSGRSASNFKTGLSLWSCLTRAI